MAKMVELKWFTSGCVTALQKIIIWWSINKPRMVELKRFITGCVIIMQKIIFGKA
jgi:hypothetical protein